MSVKVGVVDVILERWEAEEGSCNNYVWFGKKRRLKSPDSVIFNFLAKE